MPPLPTLEPCRRSRGVQAGAARPPGAPAWLPGAAGRPVIERVHVGEQHQAVGVHEVGDERGEAVVVAEPDLVGRDGVVLVDDGHDAELEQPVEGAAGVRVVRAPGHVVGGEQHLPHGEPVGTEGALVAATRAPAPRWRPPAGSPGPAAAGSGRAGRCRRRWHRTRRARPAGRPGAAWRARRRARPAAPRRARRPRRSVSDDEPTLTHEAPGASRRRRAGGQPVRVTPRRPRPCGGPVAGLTLGGQLARAAVAGRAALGVVGALVVTGRAAGLVLEPQVGAAGAEQLGARPRGWAPSRRRRRCPWGR